MINSFKEAMYAAGIICNERIIADGQVYRFCNGDSKDKDAWYVLYERWGAFGDWALGINEKWRLPTQQSSTLTRKDK